MNDEETLFHLGLPDRSGMLAYVHLIRADGEPDETMARGGGKRRPGWWKKIGEAKHWAAAIEALMADSKPRTFNTICVQLVGTTANVLFESELDVGLWMLVEQQRLAWSAEAPILFVHRSALEGKQDE